MMKMERATVIEPVTLAVAPAGDVMALDLWAAASPPVDMGLRLLRVEPRRWWLVGGGSRSAELADRIADAGTLTPIGGGLVRATLTGPGWRALLTVSGCFDTENPGFGIGDVTATIIHHVPVWLAVTGDTECEVFMASSYAPTLIDLWTRTIGTA
jgi:heterotetrameric sarcosine oxidase gamma subunit